jgi:hypothetical protein
MAGSVETGRRPGFVGRWWWFFTEVGLQMSVAEQVAIEKGGLCISEWE